MTARVATRACRQCAALRTQLLRDDADLRGLARLLARRPHDQQMLALLPVRRAHRDDTRAQVAAHTAACTVLVPA